MIRELIADIKSYLDKKAEDRRILAEHLAQRERNIETLDRLKRIEVLVVKRIIQAAGHTGEGHSGLFYTMLPNGAIEVVEAMATFNWRMTLMQHQEGSWSCRFTLYSSNNTTEACGRMPFCTSMNEAVCQAALLAAGVPESEWASK